MRGKGCIIHFRFVLLVLDQARGVHGSSYVHARHARTHVRTWKGRKLKKSNRKWHIINKMKKANNKKIVSVKMTLFL